jgi:cyclopropane fatty-acyl-phospholipid synthase-like methyltransferase
MAGKYSYANYDAFRHEVLAEIRREAFGEDVGQFSWITAEEYRGFLKLLNVGLTSVMLDVACGSGGLSLYAASLTGCQIIGVDLSAEAIQTALKAAQDQGVQDRVRFFQQDASKPLPLDDESVDAIVCVDAINHFFHRRELLAEWRRVLRPGGRFVYTDAVVVADMLRREEILTRSSRMGEFIFTPVGVHERLITAAGFSDLKCEDVTATIAATASRWHDARAERREAVVEIEGSEQFEELQRTLAVASALARERRLLRLAFSAAKPL